MCLVKWKPPCFTFSDSPFEPLSSGGGRGALRHSYIGSATSPPGLIKKQSVCGGLGHIQVAPPSAIRIL